MSGLAPTLIIVRVAYGQSVESVQQVVSIQFAERETQRHSTVNGLQTTVDIQSRRHNGDVDLENVELSKAESPMV
ncbi:hypothetical protein PQX77_022031 [Marasmius sp. AFHP31]|nr:hypothetical protein PQX77_022031 [Marasmius sp. AFHP31]